MATQLRFRVDEKREGEEVRPAARFRLHFDGVEFMNLMERYGQATSVFTLYEGRRELMVVRGSNHTGNEED